jgi:hypothetical protein
MVAQTANEAVSNARRFTSCTPGQCLMYTRTWLGIGSQQPSAIEAWEAAKHKHRDHNPPRGAPVFWGGGQYGHIALAVTKDLVRSTDTTGTGRVSTVSDTWHQTNWGKNWLGWTEDLNGVLIPFLSDADNRNRDWRGHGEVYVAKLREGTTDSDSVKRLRYRLTTHPDIPNSFKPGYGGAYGDDVVKAVKWWQRNVAGLKDAEGRDMSNAQARRLFGDNFKVIGE